MEDKYTVDQYKKILKKQGYSESEIEESFKGKPGDSRNGFKTAQTFVNRQFEDSNPGFAAPSDLSKSLNTGDHSRMRKMSNRDVRSEQGKFNFLASNKFGYGQGMKGSIAADRKVHAANFSKLPMIAGENLANSMGFLTPAQLAQSRSGGVLTKALYSSIPLGVAGVTMAQLMNNEDPYDIAATNLSFAAGMVGWNAGKMAGGVLSPKGSVVGRLGTMGSLGAIGFVAGMTAVQTVADTAKDLTSNNSQIAKKAKSIYTRSSMANIPDTQASLTLRQRTLQKLSSYGDNGRGTLLGNEAMIMKNLM